MERLIDVLERMPVAPTQRVATFDECERLHMSLPGRLVPSWLTEMLQRYRLIGGVFELAECDDVSGLGVAMQWMSPAMLLEEMLQAMPGRIAEASGFLAVGACLEGSGDPYFLKLRDRAETDPPVYRIYHDARFGPVAYEDLSAQQANLVAPRLSAFLEKAATGKISAFPV